MSLQVLDLFSGIGGFSLGLERAGLQTIAFCEINPYCRQVLRRHWPTIPIFKDIRKLTADDLPAKPDLVCGGYPCQPFSVAGKQRGKKDNRYLWPEMFRLVKECRPAWVLGENVAGHVKLGLDTVLADLEGEGYAVQPFVIPACAIGAPHKRERVWIIAYTDSGGESAISFDAEQIGMVGDTEQHGSPAATLAGGTAETGGDFSQGQAAAREPAGAGLPGDGGTLADTTAVRLQGRWTGGQPEPCSPVPAQLSGGEGQGYCTAHWQAEPRLDRVADGIPDRVDRIKSLGNAVVPQIPEIFGRIIRGVS